MDIFPYVFTPHQQQYLKMIRSSIAKCALCSFMPKKEFNDISKGAQALSPNFVGLGWDLLDAP